MDHEPGSGATKSGLFFKGASSASLSGSWKEGAIL